MRYNSEQISKFVFFFGSGAVALFSAFLYGVFAFAFNLVPVPQIIWFLGAMQAVGEATEASHIDLHLQPSRGQGSGVVKNMLDDQTAVLMAGFFDGENQARLITRDGEVVNKWSLDYTKHFGREGGAACSRTSPLRVDTHGALLNANGELTFNYEYCGTVKLDRCGKVLWTLDAKTHHSIVEAEAGGYWALGRQHWSLGEERDRLPPFSLAGTGKEVKEDTLLRIGEDGRVIEETSIPQILVDGGMEAILTANSFFRTNRVAREEIVHANKVSELPASISAAFPLFSAGDLAISFRSMNLIVVIDPDTKHVKWHQTGPWLRQHDPEFRADGRISIFNNNIYRYAYGDRQKTDLTAERRTNIMAVDPVTRETEIVFGSRPGQEMLSVIRGQHELLPGGGMIIVEFDAGRVLEVDKNGTIVWDYVNAYDETSVGEITNASVHALDDFDFEWGDCPTRLDTASL